MSITGNWIMTINSPFTPTPFDLVLADKGAGKLEGSMLQHGDPGPAEKFTGTVNGSHLSWSTQTPITTNYSGTVTGDAIAGTAIAGGQNFPFSAKRKV